MTDFTDRARDILSVAIHRARAKSADEGVAVIAAALAAVDAAAYQRGMVEERERCLKIMTEACQGDLDFATHIVRNQP